MLTLFFSSTPLVIPPSGAFGPTACLLLPSYRLSLWAAPSSVSPSAHSPSSSLGAYIWVTFHLIPVHLLPQQRGHETGVLPSGSLYFSQRDTHAGSKMFWNKSRDLIKIKGGDVTRVISHDKMLNEGVGLPIPLPARREEKLEALLPRQGLVEHASARSVGRGRKGCSFQTKIGEAEPFEEYSFNLCSSTQVMTLSHVFSPYSPRRFWRFFLLSQ